MRAAILGATGFGRFHARELRAAGVRVDAILGSTPETAAATAERLRAELGVDARPFHDLNDLLATSPDLVGVCTPHELHFEHALAALRSGAHVLCEKPLVWRPGLTAPHSGALLAVLERAGARERLALDAPHAHFADELERRGHLAQPPTTVAIHIATRGPYRSEAIAVDLLPHALSFLQRVLPGGGPTRVRRAFEPHRATLAFDWAGAAVGLELAQHPAGDKLLAWTVDGRTFHRESDEQGGRYHVFLREQHAPEPWPLEDPLRTVVRRFVASARGDGPPSADFETAAAIQRAMVALLEA